MKKLLILLLAVMSAGAVFGQNRQTVAVYVTGGQEEGANDMLSAFLEKAISKSRDYVAVERTDAFLKQLRSEYDYQASGNVDDDLLAAPGKQVAVQYVCLVAIKELADELFLSARLMNVETSAVERTANARLQEPSSAEEVETVCKTLAESLFYESKKE